MQRYKKEAGNCRRTIFLRYKMWKITAFLV